MKPKLLGGQAHMAALVGKPSYFSLIKSPPLPFPARHATIEMPPERTAVTRVTEMAQLVHENVVDAPDGQLDGLDVHQDSPSG